VRFDDLFSNISDKTAGRLSEEYPVLKDEHKERLYAMSKRKYNINETFDNNGSEVSGVEKYRRPKWYNGASIAAAAVLLVAGIGGSIAFISRNGHSPAAEAESSITETTEAVTEEVTEKVTEIAEETSAAEEVDANAIAKELTDAYRDFACDLHAGNLEVDKENLVTKTVVYPSGVEYQREFYRVTDPRYPTWTDVEKRCYEIFDAKLGQVILDNCLCDKEEDINCDTSMYTTDNGYYIEKSNHDGSLGPFDWDDDDVNSEIDENGNIITTRSKPDSDGYTLETCFTITNTENGWRISKAEEKLLGVPEYDNYDPYTDQ
jgi:phosphoribosyl-ATP pyrophosphohydrolase